MSRVLARAWTFSAIFRLNWLLLPAKYGLCFFLLKTPFSSSHRRRSRCRRLTNFLVNSALMVAMLVKLLLVLIASNTSPATSLEVSFSRSKYAWLCCKHFSFNFFTFLLFSFILRDCRSFPMRDGNFLHSGLVGLLLAYLRLLEVFRGAPLLVLELPENISAPLLQRVWSMIFSIKDFSLAVDEW